MTSNVVETIPSNRHVLVCGMTGTGKSFLTEHYTLSYKYVVKLDTKNETAERRLEGRSPWDGLKEGRDFTVVDSFDELDEVETDKIIYVVPFEEQTDENFDRFFNWVFSRENTVLWIDELMSIGTVNKYPRGLQRIYTQGRSKNVGVWACTQRPSGIPSCVTSNSSYYFVFDMMLPQDRKRIVESTGIPEMGELPNGYNFWYYKVGQRRAVKAVLEV